MAKSWSGVRKKLEQEMLCDSLKGRVQYFLTHYHGAPDNYGRFCVRVDGKEMVFANSYNVNKLFAYANQIQNQRKIPNRQWNGKNFLYDEENREVEEEAEKIMMIEGNMNIWQIINAIKKYMDLSAQDAIQSENEIIRMFAMLDRRIGRRTLMHIQVQVEKQPEWLQFFYKLRLEAEGITK